MGMMTDADNEYLRDEDEDAGAGSGVVGVLGVDLNPVSERVSPTCSIVRSGGMWRHQGNLVYLRETVVVVRESDGTTVNYIKAQIWA